jgi:LuxR family maltose regulon positive regulatory protein
LVDRYPLVAVQGALLYMLVGQPAAAERWLDAAERAAAAGTPQQPSMGVAMLALVRAMTCRNGVTRMREDAQAASAALAPGSPWRPAALGSEGIAWLLAGQPDRADPILAQAAELATQGEALPTTAATLAERCILAMEAQDWPQAETLAERALAVVRAGQLEDYIWSLLVYAVAARTAQHRGDLPLAHDHLARAARLRPLLTHAIPWLAVQALLEFARAYLALDDAAGARVVLREADDLLGRRPDLGILPQQAAHLRSQVNRIQSKTLSASSLTTAELRVLPLLRTHLTYREAGERLYISHNTVKAHALAIYRKLGVSSRSQAIERAQQLGLLPA